MSVAPAKPSEQELADFEAQCDAWFAENVAADPGFMLPLTFMEVSTDRQFDYLRDWQRKVYEAGYLGMSWPQEYGGHGMHPYFQRTASRIMKAHDAPIMLNAIANGWTGPLLLDIGSEENKTPLHQADAERRGNLVPGLFRTRAWQRPW